MPAVTEAPPDAVAAVYAAVPEPARGTLLALRALILDVAADTPGVGRLTEALRWGEASFLTGETGSGTTIRLACSKTPRHVGLYVSCRTTLLDRFRAACPGLAFEGSRAILLPEAAALPEPELRWCVAAALTYHRPGVRPPPGRSG